MKHFRVSCAGARHLIELADDGELRFVDHADDDPMQLAEAELTLAVLGNTDPHRRQLEATLAQPYGCFLVAWSILLDDTFYDRRRPVALNQNCDSTVIPVVRAILSERRGRRIYERWYARAKKAKRA